MMLGLRSRVHLGTGGQQSPRLAGHRRAQDATLEPWGISQLRERAGAVALEDPQRTGTVQSGPQLRGRC